MSKQPFPIALLAENALPHASDNAPEWVHLLTAGDQLTRDKRGPYHVKDSDAVIAASFAETDRLAIDENHATDLAAPLGQPSPARGWIVEMQARADGIWGRVEWSATGLALMADRAYRGLSPVIAYDTQKNVLAVLRASLVNNPNLRGLTALNQQESAMSLLERLAELLGLPEGASEEDIIAAVKKANEKPAGDDAGVALQASLDEIGVALGVDAGSDPSLVLNTAKAVKAASGDQSAALVALQAQVAELQEGGKKKAAEDFVDAAMAEKRAGVNALTRDTYIALHMQDPEQAQKLVAGLPKLGRTGMDLAPPADADGKIALNAEQKQVADQLGISHADFAESLKAERAKQEAL